MTSEPSNVVEPGQNLTIASHYARAVLYALRQRGTDVAPLLQSLSIQPEILDGPTARIPARQLVRLFQVVWREMDDEFLGRTTHPCHLGHFNIMGHYVLNASNLEAAIRRSIYCYNTFTRDLLIRFRRDGDQAVISLEHKAPALDPDHFITEFLLLVWHRFMGWLIGRKIVLTGATFTHVLPPHFYEYKFAFPCQCLFEQPDNSIRFSLDYLSLAPQRTQKELADYMRRSPENLLIWEDEDTSVARQVRFLLDSNEAPALPTLEELAERLHMSPYTLNRKLKREGLSYQQIKDHYRRDLAINLLTNQRVSIASIATQVGFSEAGAFSRAFKHWTGVSPLVYRQVQQDET